MSSELERKRTARQLGMAKIALGVSILFAVVAFLYFFLQGNPQAGAGLGILVLLGGIWEYRRRIQDIRAAKHYESKARDNGGGR